jgi:hypothetical protein
MSTQEKKEPTGKTERQPHRIRLPGFIKEEELGLGDDKEGHLRNGYKALCRL